MCHGHMPVSPLRNRFVQRGQRSEHAEGQLEDRFVAVQVDQQRRLQRTMRQTAIATPAKGKK